MIPPNHFFFIYFHFLFYPSPSLLMLLSPQSWPWCRVIADRPARSGRRRVGRGEEPSNQFSFDRFFCRSRLFVLTMSFCLCLWLMWYLDLESIGDHSVLVNMGRLMMAMLNKGCNFWSQFYMRIAIMVAVFLLIENKGILHGLRLLS